MFQTRFSFWSIYPTRFHTWYPACRKQVTIITWQESKNWRLLFDCRLTITPYHSWSFDNQQPKSLSSKKVKNLFTLHHSLILPLPLPPEEDPLTAFAMAVLLKKHTSWSVSFRSIKRRAPHHQYLVANEIQVLDDLYSLTTLTNIATVNINECLTRSS